MAAPAIRGSVAPTIVTNGTVSINSPSSTAVGDLLIFFLWTQGGNSATITHTVQDTFFSWFQHTHEDGTTDGRLSVCVKKATSSGANSYSPFSVANGTASQSALGLIVLQAGTYQANLDSQTPPMGTSVTNTGNQPPDPPQVAGLTGDYLVLAIAAWHVTTAGATAATTPANYTVEIQNSNASHVTHLAVARRALTGLSNATENPAAFGDNVTPNGSAAQTIAIPAQGERSGSGSSTAGSATSSGAGDTIAAGSGSASATQASSTGAAEVIIVAAGAATIAAATSSGDGVVEEPSTDVTGSGEATITAATASGAGLVTTGSDGSATAAAATSDGDGTLDIAATGGLTIAAPTPSGAADVIASGDGSASSAAATATGTGGSVVTCDGSATMAATSSSGDANVRSTASGDAGIASASSSGAGDVGLLGLGDATSSPSSTDGDAEAHVSGQGSSAIAAVSTSGAAAIAIGGDGAATIAPAWSLGFGGQDPPRLGEGEASAPAAALSGTGDTIAAGDGQAGAAAIAASGLASVTVTCEGSATIAACSSSGAGEILEPSSTGDGSASMPSATSGGNGAIGVGGSGGATIAAAWSSGSSEAELPLSEYRFTLTQPDNITGEYVTMDAIYQGLAWSRRIIARGPDGETLPLAGRDIVCTISRLRSPPSVVRAPPIATKRCARNGYARRRRRRRRGPVAVERSDRRDASRSARDLGRHRRADCYRAGPRPSARAVLARRDVAERQDNRAHRPATVRRALVAAAGIQAQLAKALALEHLAHVLG